MGISDLPCEVGPHISYQHQPAPRFLSKFKTCFYDLVGAKARWWTAAYSQVHRFLTSGAGSLEVATFDWAHAARFDALTSLAGDAGLPFALIAGPTADGRCLEFVINGKQDGGEQTLVGELVAERERKSVV